MKKFKTIILAAGKGIRMKSDLPKVLHPVCGRPMLGYVLDVAQGLGSLKTYVVLGHKSDLVKKHLTGNVSVVIQKKLLGTADAIKSAQSQLKDYKGDILVLSGDTPLLNKETIKNLIRKHQQSKAACTFLTVATACPYGYGRIIRESDGSVAAIREEVDATAQEREINEINAGIYCFNGAQLFRALKKVTTSNKKKEFYLTDIISLFVKEELRVETATTEDFSEALGINTREDLAFAQSVLRRKILKKFMLGGVTIEDPDSTYIASDAKIGRDTTIRPFTIIESNVRIGSQCTLGPFCRIRPGSTVGNHVEVGNFTEISRSTLGHGSLMKHFSFLGDAIIGRHVNIGAGVVTANYDGKKKSLTKVLDNAFIGSDSILVAPVKIGRHAMTGAGCVVTKGTVIPDNGVAIGVPARIKK